MIDLDLRIILLVVGALIIVGLIIADRVKRKKRGDMPYNRFSEGEDFELPSMRATHEAPSHDDLDELRMDDRSSAATTVFDDSESEIVESVSVESVDAPIEETIEDSGTIDVDPTLESVSDLEPASEESQEEPPKEAEKMGDPGLVLSLLILAPKGEKFRGTQINMALKEVGFRFGKMDIFHLTDGDEALVSVANVLEPGTFNPDEITTLKIPGLVIFSQLPAARSGDEVYDTWYRSARKLKAALSGRLTDMRQQPLESDYFENLRAQAESYPASNPEPVQDTSE